MYTTREYLYPLSPRFTIVYSHVLQLNYCLHLFKHWYVCFCLAVFYIYTKLACPILASLSPRINMQQHTIVFINLWINSAIMMMFATLNSNSFPGPFIVHTWLWSKSLSRFPTRAMFVLWGGNKNSTNRLCESSDLWCKRTQFKLQSVLYCTSPH